MKVEISQIPAEYQTITVESPSEKSTITASKTFIFEDWPENGRLTVTGTYEELGVYQTGETTTKLLWGGEITVERSNPEAETNDSS